MWQLSKALETAQKRLIVLEDRCKSYDRQIADAKAAGALTWAESLLFVAQRHNNARIHQAKVVAELLELSKRQSDFVADELPVKGKK